MMRMMLSGIFDRRANMFCTLEADGGDKSVRIMQLEVHEMRLTAYVLLAICAVVKVCLPQ